LNPTIYSRQGAARLGRLLSELGFPTSLLARAAGLSKRTRLDQNSCLQLLSGEVPWSLSDLATLCEAFSKEPGFFLDQQHTPMPTSAIAVPNAEGGESTVWCPPSGIGTHNLHPDAQLRHVTRLIPRMGPTTVGLYVFHLCPIKPSFLKAEAQYVLVEEDGLQVATFDHTTGDAAIFTGSCEATIHRTPLPARDAVIDSVIGEVVGLIIVC
jgi:hypothetical protein